MNIYHLLLLFSLLAVAPLPFAADQYYENCSEPLRCGSTARQIFPNSYNTYPFWGINKGKYCGQRGFELFCSDEEHLILKIEGFDLRIVPVDSDLLTIRVVDESVDDGGCPRLYDFKGNDRFSLAPSVETIDLFNCPERYSDLNCTSAGGDTYSYFQSSPVNESDGCSKVGYVPVLDLRSLKSLPEGLKQGFELSYKIEDTSCRQCNETKGICGSEASDDSDNFRCLCQDKPHRFSCNDEDRSPNWRVKIIIGVTASFLGIMAASIACFVYYRRKIRCYRSSSALLPRNISSEASSKNSDMDKTAETMVGVHVFAYEELQEATDNFDPSKELGDGGFGTVYYGKLKDGRCVAVKRLYENNYKRVEQFRNEVEILARLHHPNLVTLFGCTSKHSQELLLVYEFIPNGTLADHLHGPRAKPHLLSWSTRLKIAIETARALKYLHASKIIHRDVKSNNILLDQNFNVKVADFGLSRLFPLDKTHISTSPQGTPGYLDPDYHQCYQLTKKSDVFSFGVVLMELISSMAAVDITRHRQEINLSNMAIEKIKSRSLHEMVDETLDFERDAIVRDSVSAVAELAFVCLQSDKDMRPSISQVLETLVRIWNKGFGPEKDVEIDVNGDDDEEEDDGVLMKSGQFVTSSPNTVMMKWDSSE